MKLQIASDLYIECTKQSFPLTRYVEPVVGADFLLLSGNISTISRTLELFADWPVPVLYVAGGVECNGSDFEQTCRAMRGMEPAGAVRFLNQQRIDICGVRFLGCTLWADHQCGGERNSVECISECESATSDPSHVKHRGDEVVSQKVYVEHNAALQWLTNELTQPFDGKTIVITDRAPHRDAFPRGVSDALLGDSVHDHFDAMLEQVDFWMHGDNRGNVDYQYGRCRVLANPRGFPRKYIAASPSIVENRDFKSNWMLDIDADHTAHGSLLITQYRQLKIDCEAKESMFNALLESFPGGVTIIDKDLRLSYWNRESLRATGLPESMFSKDNPPTLEEVYRYNIERGEYGSVDPETHLRAMMELARRGEEHLVERVRPDGTVVEIRGSPMFGGGFVTTYQDTTANFRMREQLKAAAQATATANEELVETLVTLRRAQEELVQRGKLAALGSLVAGVAHQLNTPIGNGLLAASTLEQHIKAVTASYTKGELKRSILGQYFNDADAAIAMILGSLQTVVDLMQSFKQVSVTQIGAIRKPFNLHNLVADILGVLKSTLDRQSIQLIVDIPDELAMESFPDPLCQVVINLLNNAMTHGFEGNMACNISLSARRLEDGWLKICISDNGRGIKPEYIPRIFDPFFTTRMGTGGVGLGLNVVYNIVHGLLGGKIEVESALGIGTLFTITLPLQAPLGMDLHKSPLVPDAANLSP